MHTVQDTVCICENSSQCYINQYSRFAEGPLQSGVSGDLLFPPYFLPLSSDWLMLLLFPSVPPLLCILLSNFLFKLSSSASSCFEHVVQVLLLTHFTFFPLLKRWFFFCCHETTMKALSLSLTAVLSNIYRCTLMWPAFSAASLGSLSYRWALSALWHSSHLPPRSQSAPVLTNS